MSEYKVSDERLGHLRVYWNGDTSIYMIPEARGDLIEALEERLAAAEAVVEKLPEQIKEAFEDGYKRCRNEFGNNVHTAWYNRQVLKHKAEQDKQATREAAAKDTP